MCVCVRACVCVSVAARARMCVKCTPLRFVSASCELSLFSSMARDPGGCATGGFGLRGLGSEILVSSGSLSHRS